MESACESPVVIVPVPITEPPKKCIAHINHCQRCKNGLDEYVETTPECYAKIEPGEFCESKGYTDEELAAINPDWCKGCNAIPKDQDVKVDDVACVWEPKKTFAFQNQEQILKDCHRTCSAHTWHCEVCGNGISNGCGVEVKTCYSRAAAQEVYCQEIDHYKCTNCVLDTRVYMLPWNCHDWTRKQAYLDYLFEKRAEFDRDGCAQRKSKKCCLVVSSTSQPEDNQQ